MEKPECYKAPRRVQLIYKLKISIYGLKQASRQWYLKFDEVITSFDFKENVVNQCIYLKIRKNKIEFIVIYVDAQC